MKKDNNNRFIILIAFLLLWGCSVAKPETGTEHLIIASWNVQNLFDGSDNGNEYTEFKNSAGWNTEKYHARLQSITSALKGDSRIKPDILALIEVENGDVIRDLADSSCLDYLWFFFAGAPDGSIGLGVLSNLPLTETKTHSFHSENGSIPRPVAEIRVDTGSGPLVLFVCHWKSKVDGDKKTETLRRSASALIVRRLAEIEAENPGTPVIILGDLNENHDEFFRIGATYPCALLPDTEEAAAFMHTVPGGTRPKFQDFLVLNKDMPPRTEYFSNTAGTVYSPWFEYKESSLKNQSKTAGSYYYKDSWETIDHFLLNAYLFGGNGWNYGNFRVLTEPPFTDDNGHPQPYNPRTGNGLSDHLPIVLILDKL